MVRLFLGSDSFISNHAASLCLSTQTEVKTVDIHPVYADIMCVFIIFARIVLCERNRNLLPVQGCFSFPPPVFPE